MTTEVPQEETVFDDEPFMLASRLGEVAAEAALAPEALAGDGASPYLQYALSIYDEIFRRRDEGSRGSEDYLQEDQRLYMTLVRSLVAANDPIRTRLFLPLVTDPRYKLAIFEAAALSCKTTEYEAGIEVMAAYDMGHAIETELQEANKLSDLATLYMLKITAGLEQYTAIEKLMRLAQIPLVAGALNPDIKERMVTELIRTGMFDAASHFLPILDQLEPGEYNNTLLIYRLLTYLINKDRLNKDEVRVRDEEIVALFIKTRIYPSRQNVERRLRNTRKLCSITVKNNHLQLEVSDKHKNYEYLDVTMQQIKQILQNPPARHYVLPTHPKKADSSKAILEDKIAEYVQNDGDLYDLFDLFIMCCKLIALNAPLRQQDTSTTAILGQLELCAASRTPSREHHLKVDFVDRTVEEYNEQTIVAEAINVAKGVMNPLERYSLLQRIQAFCEGSWFPLKNQKASLKEALADCQQQIDHPLYSSILGLEVPAVEATETNLAAHAIANRNAADHPA